MMVHGILRTLFGFRPQPLGDYDSPGLIRIAPDGFWKQRFAPTRSLRAAAILFERMKGKILVEIGTGLHGSLAGNSMLVWAKHTNASRIIAVDLDQERLNEVGAATRGMRAVELVRANGIAWLQGFEDPIDLLYLDFWTGDAEGDLPGTGRAEAYRQAYLAAREKLSPNSLILIDDTDHEHPWKHTHIVPDARKDGYCVLWTGRQTLLQRQKTPGLPGRS